MTTVNPERGGAPLTVNDIPTPALVLDLAALDRNIAAMARFFAAGPCRLRPHVKAHKTPAIARRQLAAGSTVGLTCATLAEAETVRSFCDDILIANELAGAVKWARAAALARGGRLTVAVDSVPGLDGVAGAALRRASRWAYSWIWTWDRGAAALRREARPSNWPGAWHARPASNCAA